ncbi:MAG TPA: protein TolR [Gammaproteobacteria bacterium]|nr:protein TolR [Gammaproteobacteria bacterium]
MPQYRHNQRKPMAQINVVPYIDVMLVLLVIFMVTAPLMQQGVDVNLPEAAAEPVQSPDDKDQIIVAITADGQFFLDADGRDGKPQSAVDLANRINEMLAGRSDKKVYVRADEAVDYGHVMEAMAAIQAAGASGIGLIAEQPEKR